MDAIAAARSLNAYVLETPEKALAMAEASDARLKSGDAGPLEGASLGIKDLFCTEGVRSTAGSKILGDCASRPTSRPSPPISGATAR